MPFDFDAEYFMTLEETCVSVSDDPFVEFRVMPLSSKNKMEGIAKLDLATKHVRFEVDGYSREYMRSKKALVTARKITKHLIKEFDNIALPLALFCIYKNLDEDTEKTMLPALGIARHFDYPFSFSPVFQSVDYDIDIDFKSPEELVYRLFNGPKLEEKGLSEEETKRIRLSCQSILNIKVMKVRVV